MFCCWNPFKGRRQRKEWGDRWLVKVVVVGDSQCGKTSLIQRYSCGTLPPTYTPTLFDTTTVTSVVEDRKVQIIIQDTAGQEDLDRLRPPFYLHADAIIVCFSLNNPDSWDKVRKVWVPETRRYCGKHVPLLLVANKTDQAAGQASSPLPDNSHHVDHGQGVSFDDAADRLNPSVEEALHSADNPAFRDSTRDNADDKETGPGSPRDSGFFEWTENVVPGGRALTHEEKRSLLGTGHSRVADETAEHAFSDRTTHGGSRQSLSRVDHQMRQKDKSSHGPSGGGQDGVSAGQCSGHGVARQIGAVGYFETSALLDQGIEQVFETALTAAMASRQWRKKYRL